jgi:DNA-binding NarL/FixJ family response regulator
MNAAADPVRVVVADDDPLVRSGLRALVRYHADLAFVGEAGDGSEALDIVAATEPHVVLMDVRMPGMDGIEATRRLTAELADRPRVLVLTTFEYDDYVYDALRAGASGFLLKRSTPEEIIDAVRLVHRGESLVFPALTRQLVERSILQHRPCADDARDLMLRSLSNREREVLRLLAGGLSNLEISTTLHISLHTTKTHVASVLAKVGARDRTQAVVFAYETRFVQPDSPTARAPGSHPAR